MSTYFFTLAALLAFAGNSVLCRLALGSDAIDATSFTLVRLLSGIVMLWFIVGIRHYWFTRIESIEKTSSCSVKTKILADNKTVQGSWLSAISLFIYALFFSLGYILLDTGVGALILFGVVQITMISWGVLSGKPLSVLEYVGVFVAFMGFVYLLFPSLVVEGEISLIGFLFMAIAGIAWGVYTIRGRQSKQPLLDTAYNFSKTLPFLLLLVPLLIGGSLTFSIQGLWLAVGSGAIASGLGYALWYLALAGLSSVKAAVVQLLVPVFAALGGIIFMDELISLRLLLSSVIILGGIAIVVYSSYRMNLDS